MKLRCPSFVVALCTLGGVLSAAIYEADFAGTAPSLHTPWTGAALLDAHLQNGGWTLGSGVKTAGARDAMLEAVIENWPDADRSTLAQALSKNHYVKLVLEPAAGWQLDLSGAAVSLTIDREDFWAPTHFTVFTSVDGFAERQEVFTGAEPWTNTRDPFALNFTFPAAGYDGLTGPLEIRVYFWNGTYSKLCALTAFAVDGAVTPVHTKGTLIQL